MDMCRYDVPRALYKFERADPYGLYRYLRYPPEGLRPRDTTCPRPSDGREERFYVKDIVDSDSDENKIT